MGSLEFLASSLPPHAQTWIETWIQNYSVEIEIKKARTRKLGDYRYPFAGKPHRITVNKMDNFYLFFLTLTHEIAHMHTYSIHKPRSIKPHGIEWKNIFGNLILQSLDIYPSDLQVLLRKFARNPKAGFYADSSLSSYFQDENIEGKCFVKDLKMGDSFVLQNRSFTILKKNRTKFQCKEINTHKNYLITANALVEKIEKYEFK